MTRRFLPKGSETSGLLASAGLAALIGLNCLNCSRNEPPQNVPQGVERVVQQAHPVNIPQEKLSPWERQYMADGVLGREELTKMADYFFSNNAYQFAIGDSKYVPKFGDYRVIGVNLDDASGVYSADIYWNKTGKHYKFSLKDDFSSAMISEN